ncbi:MAG: M18 family aminopeptidase [Acidimicrobiales bacterium]
MTAASDLLSFIDASPSPYHAVSEVATRLDAAGFVEVGGGTAGTRDAGPVGDHYVRSGGLLIAWRVRDGGPLAPRRIIGAHTDSPNLRIKPHPDLAGSGMRRLAAEPYGGALLNSWLDRDLGVSGRVSVREADGTLGERLFRDDRPLLRVPQLAIHLDRDVNEKGLVLNRQQHLNPVWGLGTPSPGDFADWLADALGVAPGAVLAWDLMCHDTLPAGLLGADGELISAARLDNLCSTYGAVTALLDADDTDAVTVVALFDHEEIGSETATGAASPQLAMVLDRIDQAVGLDAAGRAAARAASRFLSADMAHGTHPNYPDRHEPNHTIALGSGPVVKVNVNGRYATDSTTAGEFLAACHDAGVPTQTYAHRADLACGSTIGPITAARLGIPTVDVGMAQLSMHSARELMAAADVDHMVRAFSAWLAR